MRWLDPPAVGRLSEIQAPTLVLAAQHDFPDMNRACEFLADNIPGARLQTITGAAHLPNMERPEEFNRLVLDFLQQSER